MRAETTLARLDEEFQPRASAMTEDEAERLLGYITYGTTEASAPRRRKVDENRPAWWPK